MFLFNPFVMLLGITFQFLIFYLLTTTKPSVKYESVWDGLRFQLMRKVLKGIEEGERSKKNWRPTIISFTINERNHTQIFALLDWISSHRGIIKMYALLRGRINEMADERQELEEKIKGYIKDYDLEVFPRVLVTPNYEVTFETIIQSETLGNLPLNTILIDFDERLKLDVLANISLEQHKNFMILRNQAGISDFKRVDVWWSTARNGNFGILLAYLITQSRKWKEKDAVIRIFSLVDSKEDISPMRDKVVRMTSQSRIDNIEINVLEKSKVKLAEHIHQTSSYSDLVIIGLPRGKNGRVSRSGIKKIKEYTDKLNASLIVSAVEEIDFKMN
jgi:hypothetical protein